MATNQGTGSGVLLGVAVALALQIPTTIAAIPDAMTRSVVQVFVLLAVVVCAVLVRPREVATMIRNSLRPPADNVERTSILPPPRGPIDFDIPDLGLEDDLQRQTTTQPPRSAAATTPHDTPNAKAAAAKK